jgi:hypothetical protein
MGVTADYAGHNDAPCSFDNLRPTMLLLEIRGSIHLSDLTCFNGYGMILEDSSFPVHCHENPIFYE